MEATHPERLVYRPARRARVRIAVLSLAVLAALLGLTAGGYVYINHVAAGIGRVPVMFGKVDMPGHHKK
jgi:hypothetical protein